MELVGKFILFGGIMFVLFGLAFMGKLGPFGKLPGDININRPNFKFYFPLTTSVLFSLALEFVFKFLVR